MPPCRVFVSSVSAYASNAVAEILSNSVVGKTVSEGDDDDEEEEEGSVPQGDKYTIIGSIDDEDQPKWLAETVKAGDTEAIQAAMLSCDVIIYNLMGGDGAAEEAVWAASVLRDQQETFTNPKTFIGLSTCMTWAKTKPADPEDPEAPLGEDEYRRRRAHMNFKAHIDAEKKIVKCGKQEGSQLSTYIVAPGLLYGRGEDAFHCLFKMAWHQAPKALPVIGNGENVLPTIHAADFAVAVLNVIESKPEPKYIVAIDEGQSTLQEITAAISEAVGSGATNVIKKEEALLFDDLPQVHYDMLTANIRLDAAAIRDFQIDWVSQEGLVETVDAVVAEYKKARGLLPVKVVVAGPPASGTGDLASAISKHYKLPNLNRQAVIDYKLSELKDSAAVLDLPEEEQPEDTDQAAADKETLAELTQQFEEQGSYADETVQEWFQERLRSRACSNQGYVMSDFPETEEQAQTLFQPGDDAEDPDAPDPATLPEFVFQLNATDEFLSERVMNLPEAEVAGTQLEEEAFKKALAHYRSLNGEDGTVLDFFDFLEIHPVPLEVAGETPVFVLAKQAIGEPRNYGPTPEEAKELAAEAETAMADSRAKAEDEMAKLMAKEACQRGQSQAGWEQQLEEVKRQEQEVLAEASLPLRNFLMKHIMPTLTQGLVEVCKSRPEDPVDYLAEYLFKNSPPV